MTNPSEVGSQPSIRSIIDPEGTLPQVELEVYDVETDAHFMREMINITSDHQVIGWCDLITSTQDQLVHFDGITIWHDHLDETKSYRAKGYGLATYIGAIEIAHARGLPFETQDRGGQSPGAKKIWELLAKRGIAEVETPFEPTYVDDGIQKYRGKYRVYPRKSSEDSALSV